MIEDMVGLLVFGLVIVIVTMVIIVMVLPFLPMSKIAHTATVMCDSVFGENLAFQIDKWRWVEVDGYMRCVGIENDTRQIPQDFVYREVVI